MHGVTRTELPVSFHYFVHFVNFTVETAGSYESRQFPMERGNLKLSIGFYKA